MRCEKYCPDPVMLSSAAWFTSHSLGVCSGLSVLLSPETASAPDHEKSEGVGSGHAAVCDEQALALMINVLLERDGRRDINWSGKSTAWDSAHQGPVVWRSATLLVCTLGRELAAYRLGRLTSYRRRGALRQRSD